jgi:two-component system response regulator QseB
MLGEGIRAALEVAGYRVEWLSDGDAASRALRDHYHDLIVLDLGLPGTDGMDLLRGLRRRADGVPVMVLTARDTIEDRIRGLDAGADDYLVKPFDVDELKARIRALLRRSGGRLSERVELGELVMDLDAQEVKKSGESIPLTRREFTVLRELLLHLGKVLTRERLEQAVYGWEEDVESNALEVHIHHLRKKLGSELIRTVRGVGYIIEQRD